MVIKKIQTDCIGEKAAGFQITVGLSWFLMAYKINGGYRTQYSQALYVLRFFNDDLATCFD